MPAFKSFGSVTVVDQMDLGNIQSYLTSNQATNIIYNPNTGVYTPDWSQTNLIITPVINFNGNAIQPNASGVTITYSRRDGSGQVTSLTAGETVANGVLTVSQNKLAQSPTGIITYICDISYQDTNYSVPVSTQNTITFSLISSGSEVAYAYILGESTFLYNAQRNLVGANKITLSADISSNVAVNKWQYWSESTGENGAYVDFPTTYNQQINTTSLDVYATEENIWNNGRIATIKLTTTDQNVYDIHQIIKIWDGAAGSDTLSIVLSNQSHYVPCDSEGNVVQNGFNGASTQVFIYEGGEDVTDEWTIQPSYDNTTIGGSWDSANHIFTPDVLSADVAYVDFNCTKVAAKLTARYTITKTKVGKDGTPATFHELVPNVYAINLDVNGIFSPQNVTFTSYKVEGDTKDYYGARFVIAETTDGTTYIDKDLSSMTNNLSASILTYPPSSTAVKAIRCRIYESGTNIMLDEQTVVVTRDGETGIDGISAGLSNYQDVIPCNENGYAIGPRDFAIPYYAYAGVTRLQVDAAIASTLPSGLRQKSNRSGTPDTSSGQGTDGLLVLTVDNNGTLGGSSTLTGEVTIRLTVTFNGEQHVTDKVYRWTKNIKARDGENVQFLQIYSNDGGIIRNSSGSTTLLTRYMDGAHEVDSSLVQYQWYKVQSGQDVTLYGQTLPSLVVRAEDVTDYAIFKVVALYNNNPACEAYFGVDDVSDPVVVTTMATVREFIDGEGIGAVFTRIHRNGTELDPLKSTVFSVNHPAIERTGDYWYFLDENAEGPNGAKGKVQLKQFDGVQWNNVDENYIYTYNYYRMDKNGMMLDKARPYLSDRCILIKPSIIGKTGETMQFICEVEE